MKLKSLWFVAALSAAFFCISASGPLTPQEKYIADYAATAVREMYRTGVPASITLAQGILESRSGLSPLASEGNNHFGIKCHSDWTGRKMFYDDDKRGECFRSYGSPDESFRDHSDFLRYSDRYKSLFELKTTDYKGWAYGLKKAGYATDPRYPEKLIKNIEDYKLDRFDKMTLKEVVETYGYGVMADELGQTVPAGEASKKAERQAAKTDKQAGNMEAEAKVKLSRAERRAARASRRKEGRKKVVPAARFSDDEVRDGVIPESPLEIEEPKLYRGGKADETYKFSLSREMYSRNGVPFISTVEGETVASIAKDNGLFVREVLKYNDMDGVEPLDPGTIIYIQPKKSQGPKGLDKYVIDHDGESLRDISQRFGIKLESICKMNGIGKDYVTREGDMLTLREGGFAEKLRNKLGGK